MRNKYIERRLTLEHRLSFDVNCQFDHARRVTSLLRKIYMHCITESAQITPKHKNVYAYSISFRTPLNKLAWSRTVCTFAYFAMIRSIRKVWHRFKHTFVRLSSRE